MLDRLAAYMHCIAPASSGGGGSATAAAPAAANAQQQPSGAAVEADCEALAEVLRLYLTASQCSDDFEGLQMATDAAAMLAAPDRQAAIARALRHLAAAEAADEGAAGEQHMKREQQDEQQEAQQAQQAQQEEQQPGLPTLAQLRYACCHLAAESALQVAALSQQPLAAAAAGQQQQALTDEQREAVQAAEDGSINELLELEPDNPKGLVAAALASGRCGQPAERVAGLYLSAHRLAVEQRSDWWATLAAARALTHAAERPEAVDGDTLAAAVAAFQQAEPPLKRCRRQLPPDWVQQLDASWDLAEQLLPSAARHVQLTVKQQAGAADEEGATGAAEVDAAGTGQAAGCAYCGEEAAALRCARCRRQVYCNRECQRNAWKSHKKTCQPAA
ncbi:hypothetical protein COHA_001122 [Chlorella ohadii]|uniref:MYND-type domain-containing protein n=1 Tax=Chlorella ohadii TaxID=2649997 RepID=A0AAD5E288_9CHLO|nr:hypothetical protein COHA_001122 [Chlorella ohadii]